MAKAALPDAAAETLGFFLQNKQLTVPSFQRDYAWLKANCEQLIWDLHQFLLSSREHYVVGQVIIAPDPSGRRVKSVVDGQQRLTTFYLIFLAVRRVAEELADEDSNATDLIDGVNNLLFDHSPDNVTRKNPRVSNTRAGRRMLEALLDGKFDEEPRNGSEENIKKNYEYLYRTIKSADDFAPFNRSIDGLTQFLDGVLTRVCVVVLSLEDREEAIEYFEKLNSRGKRLDDDDLLKALVLKDLPETLHEKSVETWQSVQTTLYAAAKSKEMQRSLSKMTFLLGAMIRQRLGERVGNRKLFEEWANIITHTTGRARRTRSGVTRISVQTFLSEIEKNGRALAEIGSGRLPNGGTTTALGGIRHFDQVQLYNVLTAGHFLGREEFERLCELAEARWVLSSLSDEQSRIFERSIPGWTKAIFDLSSKRNVDPSRVSAVSKHVFTNAEELLEGSVEEIRRLNYERRGHDKKIRYVLALITRNSEIVSKREKPSIGIDEFLRTDSPKSGRVAYALDHIYPQSRVQIEDSLKHSIGNLALLKSMANSKEGNKLPDAKIVSYEESWVFNRALCDEPKAADEVLLKEVRRIQKSVGANLKDWSEAAIERRRDFIAEEFERLMVDWLKRLEVYD